MAFSRDPKERRGCQRTAAAPGRDRRLTPRLGSPSGALGVGPLPGLLALIALVRSVLIYTPMKRYTAAALLVGAVAGAIPPLIGWTAATGRLDLPGVLLFAILVAVSFLFVPLGVAGTVYFAAALVAGALFLGHGIHGLRAKTGRRWARNEFLASLG